MKKVFGVLLAMALVLVASGCDNVEKNLINGFKERDFDSVLCESNVNAGYNSFKVAFEKMVENPKYAVTTEDVDGCKFYVIESTGKLRSNGNLVSLKYRSNTCYNEGETPKDVNGFDFSELKLVDNNTNYTFSDEDCAYID